MILLPKAVIELWRFTADDSLRPNLHHVRLAGVPEAPVPTFRAVATNGHILAQVEWETPDAEDTWILKDMGAVYLHRDKLRWCAKQKGAVELRFGEGCGFELITPDARHCGVLPEVNFPDVEQIWPSENRGGNGARTLAYNPEYMERISAHARKHILPKDPKRKLTRGVKCVLRDDLTPFTIHAEDPKAGIRADYLLMPMRL